MPFGVNIPSHKTATFTDMHAIIPFFISFLTVTSTEWIQIEPIKGKKGDEGDDQGSCWEGDCGPDIHSWTSQTWGSNNSGGDHQLPPTGLPRTSEGNFILLTSLQLKLQGQIDTHLDGLTESRESRTLKKGGMGSMESALITISLLTFAVYLIKLVLMLINALHHKKAASQLDLGLNSINPTLPIMLLNSGRKKREASAMEDHLSLLSFLQDSNRY